MEILTWFYELCKHIYTNYMILMIIVIMVLATAYGILTIASKPTTTTSTATNSLITVIDSKAANPSSPPVKMKAKDLVNTLVRRE